MQEVVEFIITECGNDPWEAFIRAKERAAVDHEGLWPSGTIADKVAIQLSPTQIREEAEALIKECGQRRIDPVLYLPLGGGEYLFIGRSFKRV